MADFSTEIPEDSSKIKIGQILVKIKSFNPSAFSIGDTILITGPVVNIATNLIFFRTLSSKTYLEKTGRIGLGVLKQGTWKVLESQDLVSLKELEIINGNITQGEIKWKQVKARPT